MLVKLDQKLIQQPIFNDAPRLTISTIDTVEQLNEVENITEEEKKTMVLKLQNCLRLILHKKKKEDLSYS